jgi:hypothetical protein
VGISDKACYGSSYPCYDSLIVVGAVAVADQFELFSVQQPPLVLLYTDSDIDIDTLTLT